MSTRSGDGSGTGHGTGYGRGDGHGTGYCQSGTMADGQETYWGAAAGNRWAFGTRLKLLTGRFAGRIVTVADRIGWGSQLDIFTWSCNEALWYGREEVQVEVVQ